MGILSSLLFPLAPVRGTIWVAEQVLDEAERRYYDVGALRRRLEEVDKAREHGDLEAEEADTLEAELVARLVEAIRRDREGGTR